jgi:glycerol-1-phosphate dehydrogenase [NAD(P)+]
MILGEGVLCEAGNLFKNNFPGKHAIIIATPGTYALAGKSVREILDKAGVAQDEPFIIDDPAFFAEWKYIDMVDDILSGTDAIPVAVGSGTINDICKLCSFHKKRRYMVIGTAASMDGYTSFGASITYKGAKQTFPCRAPLAAIADTDIMAKAPKEMTASGYADLFAKITAGADWIIADALGIEAIDPFSFGVVQDDLKNALQNPEGVESGDPKAIAPLIEGLMLSGFAMQSYHSSRTSSGADHQFSHLWDMKHHRTADGKVPSHGFKVSIGTLMSTSIYEQFMSTDIAKLDVEKCVEEWPPLEKQRTDALRMFKGTDFPTIGDTEITAKYVDKPHLREELLTLSNNWDEIRGKLNKQIIPFEKASKMLKTAGAPIFPEEIGISRKQLRESAIQAQKIRRRFTILDVAVQTGMMEKWLDAIFAPGKPWGQENQ